MRKVDGALNTEIIATQGIPYGADYINSEAEKYVNETKKAVRMERYSEGRDTIEFEKKFNRDHTNWRIAFEANYKRDLESCKRNGSLESVGEVPTRDLLDIVIGASEHLARKTKSLIQETILASGITKNNIQVRSLCKYYCY